MSKLHDLIRLAQAEKNCDKHSSVRYNAESNIVSNCDRLQSRYSNPHKQASVPICSVVDAFVTTADIYTDGASITVNRSHTSRSVHGIQGVPGSQPCTSKSVPIQGELFTSAVPLIFQQIRPTWWGSQTNVDNDASLRTAVAPQGNTSASDTDFITDDHTPMENKRKAKRLRRTTNQELNRRNSFAATLSKRALQARLAPAAKPVKIVGRTKATGELFAEINTAKTVEKAVLYQYCYFVRWS